MSVLDPEDTAPSPAGPQDSQSSDQSQSGLRQAWDAWTSRPENNAALLQFGLAMLQPRSPGQSGIGQFANAVGQGAEASERNVASQQEATKQASDIEAKKAEASARTTTARAYADQVAQGGGKGKNPGLQSRIATQKAFNSWLAKPEDAMGLTTDPIVGAVSKQFPDVKSKADLLANPAAMRAARGLFASQLAEPGDDDEGSGGPTGATAQTTAPSTPVQPSGPAASTAATVPAAKPPQARIIYQQGTGKPFLWDGIPGHQPVPYNG